MGAFTKWGRIAVAASSVAVLSLNTVLLESPKSMEQTNRASASNFASAAPAPAPVVATPATQEIKSTSNSKTPKMAPQFDGLNFYETFIGSSQR